MAADVAPDNVYAHHRVSRAIDRSRRLDEIARTLGVPRSDNSLRSFARLDEAVWGDRYHEDGTTLRFVGVGRTAELLFTQPHLLIDEAGEIIRYPKEQPHPSAAKRIGERAVRLVGTVDDHVTRFMSRVFRRWLQ